jgi:GNAT superfamily N-acetyltransferase
MDDYLDDFIDDEDSSSLYLESVPINAGENSKNNSFNSDLESIPTDGDEWSFIQWSLKELKKELDYGALTKDRYQLAQDRLLKDHYRSLSRLKKKGELSEIEFDKLCSERNLKVPNKSKLNFELIEKGNPLVRSLEDLYFRNIDGSLPTEQERGYLGENVLVAFQDKKPAGAIWTSDVESRSGNLRTYIEALYVREIFRGNNLGSKLILNVLQSSESEAICLNPEPNAVQFYQRNGFFTYQTRMEDDDLIYEKMILPLTKDTFNHYLNRCQENLFELSRCLSRGNIKSEEVKLRGEHFFSGMVFDNQSANLSPQEWNKYVSSVMDILEEKKEDVKLDLNELPFTMFVYKRLGLGHKLLDSYQK